MKSNPRNATPKATLAREINKAEITSIHIEDSDGEPHEFTFHNRNNSDCLAKKLSPLRSQFIAVH